MSKHKYPKSEKWRKRKKYLNARKKFLQTYKHCAICERYARYKQATVMDHIRPHRDDADLFWSESNWQALCKYHHDQKTATEDGALGNTERSHDWPDIGQVDIDCSDITDGRDILP